MNFRRGRQGRRPHQGLTVALLIAAASAGCANQPAPPPRTGAATAAAPAAPAVPMPAPLPPVKFLSAAEARPGLQATVSISSLDRLLGAGTALVGRAVPLPLDAASVRDMLLSQAGLSPTVGQNLDFSSPVGAVFVTIGAGETGLVFSFAAKGAAEAQKVIGALGKEIARRGEVVQLDNGTGGKGWVWRNGNVLVLSDSFEALLKGAALAGEARVPARDDVTAVLFPDAIAAGHGTDVKTALHQVLEMARAAQAAQGMPLNSDTQAMVSDLVGLVGDASTIEFGLQVSTSQGLRLLGRMNARPGSGLEKMARETRPFEIDPLIFSGGIETPVLAALTVGPVVRAYGTRIRNRLQASQAKGVAAAVQAFDAVVDAATGAGVGVAFARPQLGARFIYALKNADSAAKVSAAFKRLDSDAALALANAQMEGAAVPFSFAFKKESVGKLAALHYTITPNTKNMPQPISDGFKNLFGKAVDLYWAVSGTRLVGTAGKQARADLQKLAAAKPGEPSGEVAQAIATAKGKDLIEYLDFAPFIAFGAGLSKDPRAAAFAKAAQNPIPLVITSSGDKEGKGVTLDLTFPPSAFSGAGTILQGINGGRPR